MMGMIEEALTKKISEKEKKVQKALGTLPPWVRLQEFIIELKKEENRIRPKENKSSGNSVGRELV